MAPRAVLVGMPGAGKSAIGRRLARKLGVEFADTDQLIVATDGRSIAQIFADVGECGFRQIESDVIAQALDSWDGVLSLGGGAITCERTRELLRHQQVVLLDADDDVLIERVSRGTQVRPLLDADPAGGIARLRQERSHLYEQVARYTVNSTGKSFARVVREVKNQVNNPTTTITVHSTSAYPVYVGRGIEHLVREHAMKFSAALILYSPDVALLADRIESQLDQAGLESARLELPRAEAAKTSAVLEETWDAAHAMSLGRDGVVIAIGGGATTDLGGFTAATWMRGVSVIQVPTTLLAMVDAAVGGKTGINTDGGKNLVGAFHHPVAVICDLDTLDTLPVEDLRAGLGEVVKCGLIRDPEILRAVAEEREALVNPRNPRLRDVIERAIRIKADVVGSDFTESGLREILNYGHTLAHAIELGENYSIRHGEAVSIGCVFAAALAEAAGIAPAGFADRHRDYFGALGLPTSYESGERSQLMTAMYSDKKVRQGVLRFVVLSDFGAPESLAGPSKLDQAFDAIGVS